MARVGISVIAAFVLAASVQAVPFADKPRTFDPFDAKIEGVGGFMNSTEGWGEFAKYVSTTDGDHNWDARLGANIEAFRYENRLSVDIASDIELIADGHNDIGFRPRVFYWQESLFVMESAGFLDFGLGYYHRCSHPVDNLIEYLDTGNRLQRSAIWDSVTLRAYTEPVGFVWGNGTKGSIRGTFDNHAYVLTHDYVPSEYSNRRRSLSTLLDTCVFGIEAEPLRWGDLGWYVDAKAFFDIYRGTGKAFLSPSALAETGLTVHGRGGELSTFLRWERETETLVEPWRQDGDYLTIGMRVQ
jgi:hypothetical protein